MKWSRFSDFDQVTYDTQIPFIRMFAGPMDYTQGAMLNGTKSSYRVSNSDPMSQGTRCHQLAMYVVFEAPFNMLCDSPSNYEQEPECTQFIASIPTVWDQTKALDGKVGEYAVIARRSGDDWYVGGLNNWNQRQVEIDLSFLPEGQYELVNMVDGYRANAIARDFRIVKQSVDSSKKVKVTMAQGGGFAMKLIKK
jgi:alpha-glucosidase